MDELVIRDTYRWGWVLPDSGLPLFKCFNGKDGFTRCLDLKNNIHLLPFETKVVLLTPRMVNEFIKRTEDAKEQEEALGTEV